MFRKSLMVLLTVTLTAGFGGVLSSAQAEDFVFEVPVKISSFPDLVSGTVACRGLGANGQNFTAGVASFQVANGQLDTVLKIPMTLGQGPGTVPGATSKAQIKSYMCQFETLQFTKGKSTYGTGAKIIGEPMNVLGGKSMTGTPRISSQL